MSELPFVDEHARDVEASREAVWDELLVLVDQSFAGAPREAGARLLGCRETGAGGPRPLAEGSMVAGFRVVEAVRPSRLVLEGRHRFSSYRLAFFVDELPAGRSRLRAGTWAAFPGLAGRLYRTAVIGARGHVVLVRRMLAGVAGRAARRS